MTTNEMSNWPRYKHFRHPETNQFMNPFDKGWIGNMHEMCFPGQYPTLPTALDAATMEKVLARHAQKGTGSSSCKGCSSCPRPAATKADATV